MAKCVRGCMCVSVPDICRLESHVLHIPTCPALTALRDGMGKFRAYNARAGKSSFKSKGDSLLTAFTNQIAGQCYDFCCFVKVYEKKI